MSLSKNRWITVTVFAIAMGLLESIVVVYLRELYYPEGFSFPLKMMKPGILEAELLRELATLIMLAGIGILAGHNKITRFAWFLFTFAVWDIFYYVFLKLLLNWPESLLSWDILFLIPSTWVGPVLAPLINSACMLVLSWLLLNKKDEAVSTLNKPDWFLLITGSLIILYAYLENYSGYMLSHYSFHEMISHGNQKDILEYGLAFVPQRFNWAVFLLGVSLHLVVIFRLARRSFVESKR